MYKNDEFDTTKLRSCIIAHGAPFVKKHLRQERLDAAYKDTVRSKL